MSEATKFVIVIPEPLTFWRGLLHTITSQSAWTHEREQAAEVFAPRGRRI